MLKDLVWNEQCYNSELACLNGEGQEAEQSDVDALHCGRWRNCSMVSGIFALKTLSCHPTADVMVNTNYVPLHHYAPFQCVPQSTSKVAHFVVTTGCFT